MALKPQISFSNLGSDNFLIQRITLNSLQPVMRNSKIDRLREKCWYLGFEGLQSLAVKLVSCREPLLRFASSLVRVSGF